MPTINGNEIQTNPDEYCKDPNKKKKVDMRGAVYTSAMVFFAWIVKTFIKRK